MEFIEFKRAFQNNFKNFIKSDKLFLVDIDKDELWNTYLDSFPIAIRQEFNCNSCKQFIKNYGAVVAINDSYQLVTYWDFVVKDSVYQQVVNNLRDLVLSKPITNVFINDTYKLGTNFNYETPTIKWEHFYYEIPRTFVHPYKDIESIKSNYRDNYNVFKRSLEELTCEAINTVLDLIAENNLYRGQEFKSLLEEFLIYKSKYIELSSNNNFNLNNFCWKAVVTINNYLARIRNTAIGTLLIDLSNEVPIDVAVQKFEQMVAPTNYRRPKPVVSQRMLQDAQKLINDLGLSPSLDRRFASINDIDINNVLYITREESHNNIFESLSQDLIVNPNSIRADFISLDTFVKEVIPKTQKLEVLLENKHASNLVSLITASQPDSRTLFKWDNVFSWCYTKGLTDSLKEKVKKAGGNIQGKLRVSLEWFNYDDLDLHIQEPVWHIYYGAKESRQTGGKLDVDQNAGYGGTREPVENIIYDYSSTLEDGLYVVSVQNYNYRENIDVGFNVEVEFDNEVFTYNFDKSPRHKETITVCTLKVEKGKVTLQGNKKSKVSSKTLWKIGTNKFHNVNVVMFSPNYWQNNNVENKHLFFFIKEAINSEPTRGIFNEFLSSDLVKHNKVFELLGERLQIPYSDNQLSGLGFSTTIQNDFIVRINNKQLYKVTI